MNEGIKVRKIRLNGVEKPSVDMEASYRVIIYGSDRLSLCLNILSNKINARNTTVWSTESSTDQQTQLRTSKHHQKFSSFYSYNSSVRQGSY